MIWNIIINKEGQPLNIFEKNLYNQLGPVNISKYMPTNIESFDFIHDIKTFKYQIQIFNLSS